VIGKEENDNTPVLAGDGEDVVGRGVPATGEAETSQEMSMSFAGGCLSIVVIPGKLCRLDEHCQRAMLDDGH
jgi:hypothetical protein